jgi:hypothetical protein
MDTPSWWTGRRDERGRPIAAHKYDEAGIRAEDAWDLHSERLRREAAEDEAARLRALVDTLQNKHVLSAK